MALPYPTKVVLPFDIATAQDMNERHANDVALANGSGLDDGAVTADKIDISSTTSVTLAPGVTMDGGRPITLVRTANIVHMFGRVNATIASGTNDELLFTIPAGFRPEPSQNDISVPQAANGATNYVRALVRPNGQVLVSVGTNAGVTYVQFSMSWTV